ncbi:MAG: hypothetical protein IPK79_02195 [Vampirovibrionales bacterium]|nr:hypothetical protein [Vampirovibrionales bacterium]
MILSLAHPYAQAAWSFSFTAPDQGAAALGFKDLRWGGSSMADVKRIIGMPDEVLSGEQMYPVINNFVYYDEGGSGASTIFVFENGLLVGLHYRSAENQLVDITYFLQNNGDYAMNNPLRAGYMGYFPDFGFYQMPYGRRF